MNYFEGPQTTRFYSSLVASSSPRSSRTSPLLQPNHTQAGSDFFCLFNRVGPTDARPAVVLRNLILILIDYK